MPGRSLSDYERLYMDGYDLGAYVMDCGERGIEYTPAESLCQADIGKGVSVGRIMPSFGPVNGVFDNTASSGLHALSIAGQAARHYLIHARGVQAAPTIGDDVFAMIARLISYKSAGAENAVSTAKLVFANNAPDTIAYTQRFGVLLHAMGSETAANTSNTNHNNGASTSSGGWLMYMIRSITGTGTVTISVDDSANASTWAALSGATSGAIATAIAPTAGVIQLGTTATVRQYLRPQIAFGGSATACVYALAFIRQ
jgi:hypothetical protein